MLKSVVVEFEVEDAIAKRVVEDPEARFGVAIVSAAHGDEVPMPRLPKITCWPVVVAPPFTVRPVVVAPPPIVVEAWKIFAPVKVLLVVVVNAAPDCSQYAADEVAKKLRANLHASDEVVENERPSEV